VMNRRLLRRVWCLVFGHAIHPMDWSTYCQHCETELAPSSPTQEPHAMKPNHKTILDYPFDAGYNAASSEARS
jgi:hypothetical protein